MADTLFTTDGGGLLNVLEADRMPAYQREDSIEIVWHRAGIPNLLECPLAYRRALQVLLD